MITKERINTFWSRVDKRSEDECWPYTRATDRHGYGIFNYDSKRIGAHRFAWIVINGDIPRHLKVRHSCNNPPCCNVKHLVLGTHAENMADRRINNLGAGRRTHCPKGHELTEDNTYVYKFPTEIRQCRKCKLESVKRYEQARAK